MGHPWFKRTEYSFFVTVRSFSANLYFKVELLLSIPVYPSAIRRSAAARRATCHAAQWA